MSDVRWKIILVRRGKFYRKVTRKGGIHNRKWKPLMVPVVTIVMMGAEARAMVDRQAAVAEPSPYIDPANPDHPRILEFTPELWEKVKRKHPEFAAKCDLFRRVERRTQDNIFGTLWLDVEEPL